MTTTAVTQPHPIFLAGRWVDSPDPLVIHNLARPDEPGGATYNATPAKYEEAVTAAAAVERTRKWVDEARTLGARILLGGTTDGLNFAPMALTDVPAEASVCREEAFAPLVVLSRFTDFADALRGVNDSRFGLQAGIFTNDLAHAWSAFEELEVGGVIVNDVPTYRIDHMPYGGSKDSGLGREGVRYAIEDMTELRIMVMASPS
jgi:glyceraldehyde-3-phosphate dehydrogenase (NADP+)